jgi:AcrR family transcriptional regulator
MKTKRKYQRLTPSTWAKICAEWEVGDVTLAELSDRFGVNTRTLQAHFSKQEVVKGSKAAELASAVKEELFKLELDGKDDLTQRAKETRESAYRNAVTVETLIMAQLELAQKDPSQAFKAAGAVKLLSLAAAGLERLHNLKWTALGMNRDSVVSDELPKLIFVDLTDQEIKEIQQGHDQDDLDDPAPTEREPVVEASPEHDPWDDEEDDVIIEGEGDLVKKPAPLLTADGSRYVRDAQPAPTNRVLS